MIATTFDPATGRFGQVLEGDAAFIQLNTPPGWGWVLGRFSVDGQRLLDALPDDFGAAVVGVAEEWIPPAPAATEWDTWDWDAASRRWVAVPTLAARDVLQRRVRDQLLTATDWVVTRAAEAGEPVPAPWRAYRQALRDAPADPAWPDMAWPTPPTP